jgi:hypothetical protein
MLDLVRSFFPSSGPILPQLYTRVRSSLIKHIYLSFVVLFFPFIYIPIADSGTQVFHKTAIFVENRAGTAFNDKVSVLEDFISSHITEKGFSVLSREVVINGLKSYSGNESKVSDRELSGTGLDKLLSDSTTTLQLAQMMGVGYIDERNRLCTVEE